MSSLYEIDRALIEVLENGFTLECVDMETGEIDEAKVQEFLNNLPLERDKKLEAYGCLIKNLQAEADAIRAEEKNLAARRQAKEKRVEWLKNNIAASMQAIGETKHETAKVVFSFRKSVVVEVLDDTKLPNKYLTVKTTVAPDKVALKNALKSGEVIDGATLVEKSNLQIK